MKYYALLEDSSKIDLIQEDYRALQKMLSRNIERMALLKNGDMLKTSAIYYLGEEELVKEELVKASVSPRAQTSLKKEK